MEAQKSQIMGPGMRGAPRGGGGAMMRGSGGRPGPYDRMSGPPLGRGYGAYGPSARGSRSFKSKLIIRNIDACLIEGPLYSLRNLRMGTS